MQYSVCHRLPPPMKAAVLLRYQCHMCQATLNRCGGTMLFLPALCSFYTLIEQTVTHSLTFYLAIPIHKNDIFNQQTLPCEILDYKKIDLLAVARMRVEKNPSLILATSNFKIMTF